MLIYMYHPVSIDKLSLKQVSRILNGHGVRVKLGKHHKMLVSAEHLKKIHKASVKGGAITLTLDPYAISHNQHLRKAVGMLGRGETSESLKQSSAQNATDLMNASTARAIKGITGNGMRGRGETSESLKQSSAQNATDLMNASTARAIKGISGGMSARNTLKETALNRLNEAIIGTLPPSKRGNGLKGKGSIDKYKKWTKAIGDTLGLNSGVSQAVKQQLLRTVGQAGTAMIQDQVPGTQYQPQAMTKGEIKRMNRASSQPDFYSPSFEPSYEPSYEPMPKTKALPSAQSVLDVDIPYAQVVEDNYALPSGKLYASGLKKHKKPRPPMSEAQKQALAKGRHALRIKLNEMGAGVKKRKAKRGGYLLNAGQGFP